jgi:hypothetical protein
LRFDIGQANVVRPPIRTDRDGMAALVVLTVDAKAAREGLADQARPDHDVFGVGLLDGLSRRRFAGEPWATIL